MNRFMRFMAFAMRKQNFLWSMFAIVMITMSCAIIASCGDDNKSGGSSGSSGGGKDVTDGNIIGTWKGKVEHGSLTATFMSDGTGTWLETEDIYTYEGTFTYVKDSDSKGRVFMKFTDYYSGVDTYIYYYEIKSGKMYLYDDGYDGEQEWILTKDDSTNNGNNNNSNNANIIGTWKVVNIYDSLTIMFKSDGTGTWLETEDKYIYEGTFTYVKDNDSKGIILMKFTDYYSGIDTYIYYYEIKNGKMYISYGDYNKDPEWILTKQ